MEEQQVRLQAADLLLERGVRFKIVDAPFYLKLFRLNRITIAGLRAGTISAFSRIIIERQLDVKINDREYVNENIEHVCRTIAIALLNSRLRIKYLASFITRLLVWKVKYTELMKIFLVLVEINKAVDFTNITSLMISQMMMLMSPRMGQKRGES